MFLKQAHNYDDIHLTLMEVWFICDHQEATGCHSDISELLEPAVTKVTMPPITKTSGVGCHRGHKEQYVTTLLLTM